MQFLEALKACKVEFYFSNSKRSQAEYSRFRWAVCQIDALQRLRCDRDILMNALKNLPKTLEETYDRILQAVPEEDQLFVQHTLHYISFHNDLHNDDGILCDVLIQGVQKSISSATDQQSGRFYDAAVLRELCACLINVVTKGVHDHDHNSLRVNFAHYTVQEYLNSTRTSNSSTVFSITCKQNFKPTLMRGIMEEALCLKTDSR